MTTTLTKLFVFGGPITLVVLIAIAGYAYSQILNLSLPIPQALGLFTVVLPLITGISTQGARGLIARSRPEQYRLILPLIAVLGFQLIYETIIATLALTNILPPDALRCDLESRWQLLFRAKNGHAIQAIQDKFNCCGLNSVKDRAWPFSSPTSCSTTFPDRHKSCFGEWRQAQQITAGLLLLVALTVFLIKVVSLIYLLTSSSWMNGSVTRHFKALTGLTDEDTEDNRATMRRLIEQGDSAPYSDEPAEEPSNQGPRVQPSALVDTDNQWRDETNGHHLQS